MAQRLRTASMQAEVRVSSPTRRTRHKITAYPQASGAPAHTRCGRQRSSSPASSAPMSPTWKRAACTEYRRSGMSGSSSYGSSTSWTRTRRCASCSTSSFTRAESHEAMLRERLTKCRASEARAPEDLATAREKVATALASHGSLADRLVSAAENDRRHDCPAQQLAREPQIVEFARKHRERQDSSWKRDESLLGPER